jgi:hypothetical protein
MTQQKQQQDVLLLFVRWLKAQIKEVETCGLRADFTIHLTASILNVLTSKINISSAS